jgi:hypothetical protein
MNARIPALAASFAFALVAVACGDSSTPVDPGQGAPLGKATVTMVDLEADFVHPCTGEAIHMTGRNKITVVETESGYSIHISYPNWLGTAPDGTKYVYPGATNESSHTSASGQTSFTSIDRQRFIGSGPEGTANDFLLDVSYHYTINANGEVTVDIANVEANCE